jgi:hypothetical protein
VESALNSGLWKVNGMARYFTVEGVHETNTGYLSLPNPGPVNPLLITR